MPIFSLLSLISLLRPTSLTYPTLQYVRLCPHCSIVLYLASLFSPTLLLSLSSLENLSSLFFCPQLLSPILSVSSLCLCPHCCLCPICCLCPQYWLFLHCCLNPTFSLSPVLSLVLFVGPVHTFVSVLIVLLFCLCPNFVSALIVSFPPCFLCHCCLSLFSM